MKKILVFLLVAMFAVSMAVVAGGCKAEAAEETVEEAVEEVVEEAAEMIDEAPENIVAVEEFFVGLVEPVLTGNSFQVDLAAAAEAEGEKVGVRLESYAPPEWGDFEKQISIIEDLITKEVDFVILNPSNPQAIVPGLEMLMDAGIPVINIDNLADGTPGEDFMSYIGTHNLEAAEFAGDWIAEKIT